MVHIHKIPNDSFWKESQGISLEDLQEGLYNCLDCGKTLSPFDDFTVVKVALDSQERTK